MQRWSPDARARVLAEARAEDARRTLTMPSTTGDLLADLGRLDDALTESEGAWDRLDEEARAVAATLGRHPSRADAARLAEAERLRDAAAADYRAVRARRDALLAEYEWATAEQEAAFRERGGW